MPVLASTDSSRRSRDNRGPQQASLISGAACSTPAPPAHPQPAPGPATLRLASLPACQRPTSNWLAARAGKRVPRRKPWPPEGARLSRNLGTVGPEKLEKRQTRGQPPRVPLKVLLGHPYQTSEAAIETNVEIWTSALDQATICLAHRRVALHLSVLTSARLSVDGNR